MAEPDESHAKVKAIDTAIALWRQGDCVCGELGFVYRFNLDFPVTDAAKVAAAQAIDLTEAPVRGLVVVSQTCDIVRDYTARPYVEVAPLVEITDTAELKNIERNRIPRYVAVPSLIDQHLVADTDRVMTIEKPVLTTWSRVQGCRNDNEIRAFAWSLARKRSRFAFPDDFVRLVKKLQTRFVEKHGKHSVEGDSLRALSEVRVRAVPNWDSNPVQLHFWFIRDNNKLQSGSKSWDEHLKSWRTLLPPTGRFTEIDGVVLTLDDMTARDYVESDPLDLDHLSRPVG